MTSSTSYIGRLVEDDHVGLLERQAGEANPTLLTAGDELHGLQGVVPGHLVSPQVGPEVGLACEGPSLGGSGCG